MTADVNTSSQDLHILMHIPECTTPVSPLDHGATPILKPCERTDQLRVTYIESICDKQPETSLPSRSPKTVLVTMIMRLDELIPLHSWTTVKSYSAEWDRSYPST
jgi:hypothetical protein